MGGEIFWSALFKRGGLVEAGLEKLGVVYEPGSVKILSLAAAVANRWSLVWILDARTDSVEATWLSRIGEVVDLSGLDAETAAAKLSASEISGLTAFADGCLIQMADFAERLGIPGNSPHTAQCLVDKLAERRALAAHGVPTPGFCGLTPETTRDAAVEQLSTLHYPGVVKPAVGVGGRNVVAALDLESVITEVEARRAAGDRGTIIVEECLGPFPPAPREGLGDYLSVELVSLEGRHQLIAVTGRMPLAPPFRETGAFVPAMLSDEEYEAAVDMAIAAADALEVRVGCLHVEIKLTDAGPRVIEVNGRSGGGGIPQVLADVGAANPYYCAAAAAMGVDPRPVPPRSSGVIGYAFAAQPPLNRPARLAPGWRERVNAIPGTSRVELRAEESTAQQNEGAYGYLVMVGGTVATRDGLVDTYNELNELVELL